MNPEKHSIYKYFHSVRVGPVEMNESLCWVNPITKELCFKRVPAPGERIVVVHKLDENNVPLIDKINA